MRRLVLVSNRLPSLPAAGAEERGRPVGGLATALSGALKTAPGSLWLGWSGTASSAGADERAVKRTLDGVQLVGLPLTQREIAQYYRGFCNETLWPIFHGFLGQIRLDSRNHDCYRQVNERFARALAPLLRPADLVWVHDYHFLGLGRELRRLGWKGAIGFFLHIPFPPYELWEVLPRSRELLLAMLDYDLVGFQTRSALDNYLYCWRRQFDGSWDGVSLAVGPRSQRAGAYPIGIEPSIFLPPESARRPRARRGELSRVVRGRRLLLGVDRLDYTKGIPERLLAFEALIGAHPALRRRVSFVQIASPSRSRVPQYTEQKQRVDSLVGRINGELADHDWVPLRYLYRSYPQEVLARFYREADVGLVTPLRDGMNLIAKEFVAAQYPDSPGVLVLSRLAGAAEQLPEAVLVNPFCPDEVAEGIAQALAMPIEERRERHGALLSTVLAGTAGDWSRRFLDDLQGEIRGESRRPTAAVRES